MRIQCDLIVGEEEGIQFLVSVGDYQPATRATFDHPGDEEEYEIEVLYIPLHLIGKNVFTAEEVKELEPVSEEMCLNVAKVYEDEIQKTLEESLQEE